MVRVGSRLVFASIRRSPVASGLSLVVVAIAAAVIVVALSVQRAAADPWERAFRAANGPHVVVSSMGDNPGLEDSLAGVRGVSAVSATRHAHVVGLGLGSEVFGALVTTATADLPQVDRPLVTSGRWLRGPGEVVLEESFAGYHGLQPGDTVTLEARDSLSAKVVGTASVVTREPYPQSQPGSAFATPATLAQVGVGEPLETSVALRLDDPDAASSVAQGLGLGAGPGVSLTTWEDLRSEALAGIRPIQAILSSFAVLLLVVSGFVLFLNTTARSLTRATDLSTLKAVGMPPSSMTILLVAENAVLGLLGSALGVSIGSALLPLFDSLPGAVLGGGQAPVATVGDAAIAVALSVFVSSLVAGGTAARIALRPVAAVATSSPSRKVASRLDGVLGRFGAAAKVGGAQSFAHRRRALVALAAMTVSSATIVSALAMESTFDRARESSVVTEEIGPPPGGDASAIPSFAVVPPRGDERQIRTLVYTLGAVLSSIALANLVGTALLDVRERIAEIGILKAVGMTPAQVLATFLVSGAVIAGLAGAVGIPLGLGFFRVVYEAANGTAATIEWPSITHLLLVTPAVCALGAMGITGVAFYASRISPATALAYE